MARDAADGVAPDQTDRELILPEVSTSWTTPWIV
jgi:hypothetical protein